MIRADLEREPGRPGEVHEPRPAPVDLPDRRHFTSSAELRAFARRHPAMEPTLLAFSGGKDAVGAWLALRDAGFRVVPVYLYLVPDLEFVEDGLRMHERFFGVPIRRWPHPSVSRWLASSVLQSPERVSMIRRAQIPVTDYAETWTAIRMAEGLPHETMVAQGVRASDSIMRRTSIKTHGSLKPTTKVWYPIFDWSVEDLDSAFARAGARLGREYRWFGRSFDGLDFRFISEIKAKAPRDYATIQRLFPLVEAELLRAEWTGVSL